MHKVIIFHTRFLLLLSLIFFPVIFLLIFFRKYRNQRNHKVLKIFVVPQLTRIGDLVCTTPVFSAIKEKYPDCRLVVLSSLSASGIILNNPNIDEIIIIENYQNNFWSLLNKIKQEKFDLGISLSGTALSSLLFFFGLIPLRIKITRLSRPVAEILTDWLSTNREQYSELSYLPLFYLKMLHHLGINKIQVKKEVFTTPQSEEKVVAWLIGNNINLTDQVVGISLSAGNKIKEWGDDNFRVVAEKLVSCYGMKIILIGGRQDNERINKFIQQIDDNKNYLNGSEFSLIELPALISRFNYFISVDTGPVHIAEALGVPLIDILGPVNDVELTPRGDKVSVVKPPITIKPSVFAFQTTTEQEQIAMAINSIKPQQVLDAFSQLVKSN